MVESMDANLRRVLTHLRKTGLLDNTWIPFFSDNGPEGTDALTVLGNESWVPRRFNNALDNLGRVNSYASLGPGWAQASATPFRLFKSFVAEGGIRSPAIDNVNYFSHI
jgi:Arylsulfatase A and related enzymes